MSDRVQQQRGLPSTFALHVPQRAKAISLGDYLDEKTSVAAPPLPVPASDGLIGAHNSPTQRGQLVSDSVSKPEIAVASRPPRPRRRTPAPPRKQVNMKPETLQRAEELVQLLRTHGPQRDFGASELFQAIIDVVYDARGDLQFSRLVRRGRWGTDKARAASRILSDVIEDAIVDAAGRR